MFSSEKTVVGTFENVVFPKFNKYKVVAKVDTGAYTGALHCTKIRVEETQKGDMLYFSPFDHPELEVSMSDFAVDHVKSSNGKKETRYFINTDITIADETYPIVLSLANRSEMKWPVLIGRKFLRKHRFVVDVNKTNK